MEELESDEEAEMSGEEDAKRSALLDEDAEDVDEDQKRSTGSLLDFEKVIVDSRRRCGSLTQTPSE